MTRESIDLTFRHCGCGRLAGSQTTCVTVCWSCWGRLLALGELMRSGQDARNLADAYRPEAVQP